VELFLYGPFVLLGIAALLWVYGKDWHGPARYYAWLGCSILGTIAAVLASVLLAFVAAMIVNHGGGDGARAVVIVVAPLLLALLLVALSARGRAGPAPTRQRLLRMLALAAFAVVLIVLWYLIVSS
jgi:hypothetical protein